jgi:hypothetical protein
MFNSASHAIRYFRLDFVYRAGEVVGHRFAPFFNIAIRPLRFLLEIRS